MKNIKNKVISAWTWLKADRKRLIGAILVVLVLLFVYFKQNSASKNKITYQTATVAKGTVVSSVSASGQILTSNLVNVSTQASGIVKTVYVKNGDKVFAGQKIAVITLDSDGSLASTKAWASLVSANNSLNSANNSYRSTQASLQNIYDQVKGHDSDETLVQKETRTKAEVANDNAYDSIKSATANLASASLSYRLTSPIITAPSTGIIDNITLTPGMVLSNSSTATTTSSNRVAVVTTKGNPIATFNVSEVDVNRVKQGQKATITLDSISDKTFTGVVLTVDKIGTVASGVTNYPVVISLDTNAPEILPNMAATASIIIDTKSDVLLVPSDAIQTAADGTTSVRVLENGKPVNLEITTGLSSDTQTEVTSGLNEGSQIITGTSTGTTTTSGSTSPFSTFRVGGAGAGRATGR
ncbi:MAG TPA: efflux RND transporter periplasmic adaptor subunit [Patescibacteria group bacterium]|nr:efflux RND transporter periplasmic adaptor subunit [Patescibacteria group bacterium]